MESAKVQVLVDSTNPAVSAVATKAQSYYDDARKLRSDNGVRAALADSMNPDELADLYRRVAGELASVAADLDRP